MWAGDGGDIAKLKYHVLISSLGPRSPGSSDFFSNDQFNHLAYAIGAVMLAGILSVQASGAFTGDT